MKLVKYVIANRGEPQLPFGWLLYVASQLGGWIISDSNTSFHPADVISLQCEQSVCMYWESQWSACTLNTNEKLPVFEHYDMKVFKE